MIYVELFWNFLMIGALSFGGGYGMILLSAGLGILFWGI